MKIMEQIIGWLAGILLVVHIPYLIYYNVIQNKSRWRCRGKKYFRPFNPCRESGCKFAKYCDDYEIK